MTIPKRHFGINPICVGDMDAYDCRITTPNGYLLVPMATWWACSPTNEVTLLCDKHLAIAEAAGKVAEKSVFGQEDIDAIARHDQFAETLAEIRAIQRKTMFGNEAD